MTAGIDFRAEANKALEQLSKSRTGAKVDDVVEQREREHGMNAPNAFSKKKTKKSLKNEDPVRHGCLVPWGGPAGGGSSGR